MVKLAAVETRTADMVRAERPVVPFRAPVTADGARILTGPEGSAGHLADDDRPGSRDR